MKLSLSTISAFALLATPFAFAQVTVDVPISVEILNPAELVTMSVSTEGDLGQIARGANTVCLYEYRRGALTIEDFGTKENTPAPGATSTGCAQFGDAQRPVLNVTCPEGMTLPLIVGTDSKDNLLFGAREVLFDGNWYDGSDEADGYTYLLTCPAGDSLSTVHPLELGIFGGVDGFNGNEASGEQNVSIPVSVVFE